MIGRLQGVLLEKRPPQLLVDVGGVGYELDAPMSTVYGLPDTGQPVSLYTHLVIREDAQQLYGFATAGERELFRRLIKVAGVGPKIALALLSGLSVAEFTQAVASQDAARLARTPGIGKKTAERLTLELRDKLAAVNGAGGLPPPAAGNDIVHALLALGYSDREADAAYRQLPAGVGVSEGIRQALKGLARP